MYGNIVAERFTGNNIIIISEIYQETKINYVLSIFDYSQFVRFMIYTAMTGRRLHEFIIQIF